MKMKTISQTSYKEAMNILKGKTTSRELQKALSCENCGWDCTIPGNWRGNWRMVHRLLEKKANHVCQK